MHWIPAFAGMATGWARPAGAWHRRNEIRRFWLFYFDNVGRDSFPAGVHAPVAFWIPAYAGMTPEVVSGDVVEVGGFLMKLQKHP